jgi:RNA-directed DNA polymerase
MKSSRRVQAEGKNSMFIHQHIQSATEFSPAVLQLASRTCIFSLVTKEPAQLDFFDGNIDQPQLFAQLFGHVSLHDTFYSKFKKSTGKGIDRLNGFQFEKQAANQLPVASNKCIAATFRFAPYLESLKTKGRSKPPRLISIPIVRDRVVLKQLNNFLASVFPDRVAKNIAASYIRRITSELNHATTDTWICSTDIKTFYDKIPRDRLLKVLGRTIDCPQALTLIRHAISTPTIPKNTHRSRHHMFHSKVGVPQGLAISNILALIYMKDIDDGMKTLDVAYFRFVDDVLMYGSKDAVTKAFKSLQSRLRIRGLALHSTNSNKSHIKPLHEPFGYLGYRFEWPKITVRDTTVENLLQSIAGKFSDFLHNGDRLMEKHAFLTPERLRHKFLTELNERITGAISEHRRYGWIAYFNQINDMTLLHKLDATIENMFARLTIFNRKPPGGLKRRARAYYEMKYNPNGGYVHDYDALKTPIERLTFLFERGRVSNDAQLTDAQINERFEQYRFHALAAMHNDEGIAYG